LKTVKKWPRRISEGREHRQRTQQMQRLSGEEARETETK
jgi:hypothetical protein